MGKELRLIACSDLREDQIIALRSLEVSNAQREFGGSFDETLQECRSDRDATTLGFGIHKNGIFVGILALKRPPASPDWVQDDAVSLHGLKIDQRWQGQGLGKQALALLVEEAAIAWPKARRLVLSVDAGNAAALALYRGFGMDDSGPAYSGRVGREHRMSLLL